MTRNELLRFLQELERRIPPPANCHHTISCCRYGSDAAGWQEKLALQVNRDSVFHAFFLDEDDCRDLLRTLTVICDAMAGPVPANAQLGVASGKYL
jgi:hypothetical protein